MSEAVLAAMIAAGATVFTSLLQLKASLAREVAARAHSAVRRKNSRTPMVLLVVMLAGAAVGGFAVARWLTERERAEQNEQRQELQARITEISRTASKLDQTLTQGREEIQKDVLKRMGAEGVLALATVAPCKPPRAADAPLLGDAALAESSLPDSALPESIASEAKSASAPACSEADATPVTVCAPLPGAAIVSEIELYTRYIDSDASWSDSRILPGQELNQARFSEKPSELTDNENNRHVCHTFANWSAQHGRVARMVVRYTM